MRTTVELKKLEELVKCTNKRVEMAEKVLEAPTKENLIEYNQISDAQADLKADLQISIKLSKAEEVASTIWLKKRDELEEDW